MLHAISLPADSADMIGFPIIIAALVGFVSCAIILFYGTYLWRRSKMPPGPFPLPILGNFLQLRSEGMVTSLVKMSKKYGPIYTVYFGSRPTVIVAGYEALKEVFIDVGDAFLNRGYMPVFERLFRQDGISYSNGDAWRQLRQFSLMTFKDFGMGRKSIEEPILEEVHHIVEHLQSLNEQPWEPSSTLICATSNIIAKILTGSRYDYDDKNWRKVLEDARESFHIMSSLWGQLYDLFPAIMKHLPGPHTKIFTLLEPLENVLWEQIKSHQETLDPACPRDYIDCFLIRMKQEQKNNINTPFITKNLMASIYDMFLGGTESTAVTISYGYLLLIKYPELQEKLHEEIDRVIGQSREPRVEDRNQMPYMNATIHEIQRYSDIFPMGFARSSSRDVTLRGYCIPKGTVVFPMLTTGLKDPTQFETPERFNIKHFLDENDRFKKNNAFMAFGAGKRACIAESMVRIELFLFLSLVLQKFQLKSVVDPKDLDISPTASGMENVPPTSKIIFTPRILEGGA